MSWSVYMVGTPENLAKALEVEGASWDGQSKLEFDAAKSALIALVKENFVGEGQQPQPTLVLEASGSGYANGGQQIQRSCAVSLKPSYLKMV